MMRPHVVDLGSVASEWFLQEWQFGSRQMLYIHVYGSHTGIQCYV